MAKHQRTTISVCASLWSAFLVKQRCNSDLSGLSFCVFVGVYECLCGSLFVGALLPPFPFLNIKIREKKNNILVLILSIKLQSGSL